MTSVDSHAHIFRADSPVVAGARYVPADNASIEMYLSHLDQHGFDHGVLIQPSFLGFDNIQMIEGISRHPDRLRGVAVVPLDVDDDKLAKLSDGGVVGARLNLFGQPLPRLEEAAWQGFLERLGERNWQLELHCPPHYLTSVLPQLNGYPGPIVIDHFGRVSPQAGTSDPDYRAFLELLRPDQHWVKLSGYYRLGDDEIGQRHAKEALELLRGKGMEERLVWGSDWPHTQHSHMDYDQAVDFMDTLLPEDGFRKRVLETNAQELFGLRQ